MKYFLPDSQDLVDPSFDFERETRSIDRMRQRDDQYAHEVFSTPAYDGVLVSKGIVDGGGAGATTRYTIAQRQRLLRLGAREFFRLEGEHSKTMPVMGDCGAFTYFREKTPPFTVDAVLDFYTNCEFDLGISVDHVILDFDARWDDPSIKGGPPAEWVERQQLTLELADEFLTKHRKAKLRFEPLGVAQGWSPASYAHSVEVLQKIGYEYIAVGGMVPLRTPQVMASLERIAGVRRPATKLHLLGITRLENVERFQEYGVASLDSTSPLRQAFKDDKDNYYTLDRTYTAIRIPQIDANPSLLRRIKSGAIRQEVARKHELASLKAMREFDAGRLSVSDTVDVLRAYELVFDSEHDHSDVYREVLEARPWAQCACDVCKSLSYHVILFRGAERNRRRGFHNIWTFYRRLQRELGTPGSGLPDPPTKRGSKRQTSLQTSV